MGNYSKLIGAVVGGLVGFGTSKGLPTELATPEIQAALTVLLSAVATWRFPTNKGQS